MEHFLCFMRRDISDGAVQALGVVPIDPFQRFPALLMALMPPPTGIELAKRVCQLHGACANGAVIFEPLQLGGGATGAWLSAVCELLVQKKGIYGVDEQFLQNPP